MVAKKVEDDPTYFEEQRRLYKEKLENLKTE